MTPEEHRELRAILSESRRNGSLYDAHRGLQAWLDNNHPTPSVPLAEVKAVRHGSWEDIIGAFDTLIRKYEPKPANPHAAGTYLWAREEHIRDHQVRLGVYTVRLGANWDRMEWNHHHFATTEWELVP